MSTRYKFPTYEIRIQRLQETPGSFKVDTPMEAVNYWREKITIAPWFNPEREACVVINLNTRYSATSHAMVSVGSINESVVRPMEVFRPAVAVGAYAIVLLHNHPSGDPLPSEADTRLTRRLAEAGNILQVSLLDHVIVGVPNENRCGYYSFKEGGLL